MHNTALESRLMTLALLGGLPGNCVALLFIWQANISVYLQCLLTLFIVISSSFCLYLLNEKLKEHFISLANLVEALNIGDFTLRAKIPDENTGHKALIVQLNRLADTLTTERFEYKESQLLLAKLIKQINVVIFSCDQNHNITMANPAAEKLFHKTEQQLKHCDLTKLDLSQLMNTNNNQLLQILNQGQTSRFHVFKDHFREQGHQHTLYILSDLELLISRQEQKAWQDLVRVISHEINNSLSPINSLAATLNKLIVPQPIAHEDKQDILEGLIIIAERSERLSEFIEGYKTITHLPKPNKVQTNLREMLEQLANLMAADIAISSSKPIISAHVDPSLFEQCLINLIKNAVEAAPNKPIQCDLILNQNTVELKLLDHGPGVSNPNNLFVPLYTTKAEGTGTGLVLCKQIVQAHQGQLSLNNHPKGGCEVTITLPIL